MSINVTNVLNRSMKTGANRPLPLLLIGGAALLLFAAQSCKTKPDKTIEVYDPWMFKELKKQKCDCEKTLEGYYQYVNGYNEEQQNLIDKLKKAQAVLDATADKESAITAFVEIKETEDALSAMDDYYRTVKYKKIPEYENKLKEIENEMNRIVPKESEAKKEFFEFVEQIGGLSLTK